MCVACQKVFPDIQTAELLTADGDQGTHCLECLKQIHVHTVLKESHPRSQNTDRGGTKLSDLL